VRCIVPSSPDAARQIANAFELSTETIRLGERLPMELWERVSPGAGGGDLPARIKRTFDPSGVLNPGVIRVAT
jgi:FAD/FMN-containing dehydrogenase